MSRSELGNRVADRAGLETSAAKDAVDAVFAVIGDALAKGEDVRVAGFGAFGTRKRAARTGRNPRTGKSVSIAASTAPTFKPGKAPKDSFNAEVGSTAREATAGELDAEIVGIGAKSEMTGIARISGFWRTGHLVPTAI